mgnify:CR=1 FL=1
MSILTKIFSAGATELVKGVGSVIDNLHTSKDEKLAAELMVFIDSGSIDFNVDDEWKGLLQIVLITMVGAFFGGRTFEKVTKVKKGSK